MYTSAGPEALDDAEIDEDVDSAKMDHFFWLGPGETTYTIKGERQRGMDRLGARR